MRWGSLFLAGIAIALLVCACGGKIAPGSSGGQREVDVCVNRTVCIDVAVGLAQAVIANL